MMCIDWFCGESTGCSKLKEIYFNRTRAVKCEIKMPRCSAALVAQLKVKHIPINLSTPLSKQRRLVTRSTEALLCNIYSYQTLPQCHSLYNE